VADRITAFAGSMNFVWIHAALFAVWMLLMEKSPWPTLTLVAHRGDLSVILIMTARTAKCTNRAKLVTNSACNRSSKPAPADTRNPSSHRNWTGDSSTIRLSHRATVPPRLARTPTSWDAYGDHFFHDTERSLEILELLSSCVSHPRGGHYPEP
jgi:hypothetical protein